MTSQTIECLAPLSLEQAAAILYRENSYTRLPALIGLAGGTEREDWLRLLGEHWTGVDNVGQWLEVLLADTPFSEAKEGPIFEMMEDEEISAWRALPDEVTVFRGCYANNTDGVCWSLDKAVAERFPTLHRYRGDGPPLLVEARVSKNGVAAVKLDRGEAEIVTAAAVPVSTTVLCVEVTSC